MKTTKKSLITLALVVALAASFVFAGCGNKSEAAASTETEAVTEATEATTETEVATEAATEATTEATTEAAETKQVTLEVVDNEGTSTSYEVSTDAEYLSEVFNEIGDLTVEGYDSDYGFYITTVNGLEANYDTDGAYWAIYVNGEYGMYGADTQPVADGDTYSLKYEQQ
ncbi:MAG: DUF4430 domain-containing protein [Lachnospiraceae bacterium]|nr:DUF4430 domain-containing protein [Lachnospiraceae bacterium]